MILRSYRHGLRTSEVCNLKLADLDVKVQTVMVRRRKGSPAI
jgi:integrase